MIDFIFLVWVGAAIAIFVFPIVLRETDRQLWLLRFRERRWNVTLPSATTEANEELSTGLSKEQEAELRNAYLNKILKPFTKTVTSDDVVADNNDSNHSNDSNDSFSVVSSSSSSSTRSRNTSVRHHLETNHTRNVHANTNGEENDSDDDDDDDSVVDLELGSTSEDDFVENSTLNNTTTTTFVKQPTTPKDQTVSDAEQPSNHPPMFLFPGSGMKDLHGHTTAVGTMTESSTSGDDDDDDDDDVSRHSLPIYEEDNQHGSNRYLMVPLAGHDKTVLTAESASSCQRRVSNTCAICLASIAVEDQITWSGNPDCSHVFHTACIHSWFAMAGQKHLSRMRRRQSQEQPQPNSIKMAVTQFPMPCPCCRQTFVAVEETDTQRHQQGLAVQPSQDTNTTTLNAVAEQV